MTDIHLRTAISAPPVNFTFPRCNDTIREQAKVAQLVEQLIRNQQVIGSSPIFGSSFIPNFKRRILDRTMASYGSPLTRKAIVPGPELLEPKEIFVCRVKAPPAHQHRKPERIRTAFRLA